VIDSPYNASEHHLHQYSPNHPIQTIPCILGIRQFHLSPLKMFLTLLPSLVRLNPWMCIVVLPREVTIPLRPTSMTRIIIFARSADMEDFSTILCSTTKKAATQNPKAISHHLIQVIFTPDFLAATICKEQVHPFSRNHPPGIFLPLGSAILG
jgi:hypothetical protein